MRFPKALLKVPMKLVRVIEWILAHRLKLLVIRVVRPVLALLVVVDAIPALVDKDARAHGGGALAGVLGGVRLCGLRRDHPGIEGLRSCGDHEARGLLR